MFLFNALLPAVLALQAAPAMTTPAQAESPPPVEQVMVVPEGLRAAFHAKVMDATAFPEQRLRKMVDFMFDKKDGLGLEYKPDATNTVAESYRTRQVNCLSFTLMAIALAREAGMKARGQQIDRVLATALTGDVVMQSLHANAVITLKDRTLWDKDARDYVLDIASDRVSSQVQIINHYVVDDQRLLSFFYGNRAMELMATGQTADAKQWLDVALQLNPGDVGLWNNAGVLSQRMGDEDGAERWFLRAARQDPRLTSALSNLVVLYNARHDTVRAGFWRERADSILRRNPYYQFSLGESNAQTGNYQDAIRYYQRAISLDGTVRLFHFGLARAYVKLDLLDAAEKELATAYRLSDEGIDRRRFQAKLDALQRMAVAERPH